MSKMMVLGLAALLGASHYVITAANPPVDLQTSSPGTPQTGHLNITGTATVGLLKSQGTVFGASTAPTGFAYGGFFTAASNQGRGFYGFASSPTGLTYGGFFQNASDSGRAIYGLATATTGFNYGGYFQTASDQGRGLLGVAASPTGTTYGVYGKSVSPNGFGVYSDGNMSATGIISGNGVGLTSLNASNLATGTVGDSLIPSTVARRNTSNIFTGSLNQFSGSFTAVGPRATPIGVSEVLGVSANTSSFGGMYVSTAAGGKPYYGYNNVGHDAYTFLDSSGLLRFAVDGPTVATLSTQGRLGINISSDSPAQRLEVRENSDSTIGAISATNGTPILATPGPARRGVTARVAGPALASALTGYAESSNGSNSLGVFGGATGNGLNFAVYGISSFGSTNYAGYFDGLLYAQSSSSGVKSFLIDHPLDPANKFLEHSSVESDERMDIYRGSVKTDASGSAYATLPAWFEALNEDVQYQLTVVEDSDSDQFVMCKVAKHLKNGKFKIRTSAPGIIVNWQVSARRHDPTSNFYPLQVERDKNAYERGKYLAPEAHGKDRSLGMAQDAGMMAPSRANDPPAEQPKGTKVHSQR